MNKNTAFKYNQNLFISSTDRVSGVPENFIVQLQDKSPGFNKDIGVVNIEIPYTYYNINNSNNTLGLSVSAHTNPATLVNGNYTSSSFTSMLNTVLSGVSTGVTFLSSVSTTTGLLSITGFNTGPAFGITAPTWMGVSSSSVVYNSNGTALTLAYPINLAGTPYIDVRCDIPLNSVNSKDFNRFILARVLVNTTPFNTIFYNNDSFNYVNSQATTINSLNLSLYDAYGNQMDLNGQNWELTLEISSNDV